MVLTSMVNSIKWWLGCCESLQFARSDLLDKEVSFGLTHIFKKSWRVLFFFFPHYSSLLHGLRSNDKSFTNLQKNHNGSSIQTSLLETQLIMNAVSIMVYLLNVCVDHICKKDNWPWVTTCPQVSAKGEQITKNGA